jgi:hypothetical protein
MTSVMSEDIRSLLPRGKSDGENARAIIAKGYPAIAPVLPELMEWLQDPNWPIHRVIAPFLGTIGEPLIPHVRDVLASNDDGWKYQVLEHIVATSPEIVTALRLQLTRMATEPTSGEKAEEVDQIAKNILALSAGLIG